MGVVNEGNWGNIGRQTHPIGSIIGGRFTFIKRGISELM